MILNERQYEILAKYTSEAVTNLDPEEVRLVHDVLNIPIVDSSLGEEQFGRCVNDIKQI